MLPELVSGDVSKRPLLLYCAAGRGTSQGLMRTDYFGVDWDLKAAILRSMARELPDDNQAPLWNRDKAAAFWSSRPSTAQK